MNDTLGTLLTDVIRDPRLQDFSVATNVPPDQREQNIRYIQTVAKKFLDAIVGSTNSLPTYIPSPISLTLRPLRDLFYHISVCSKKRFGSDNPTAPYVGVGSIVFLRFLGPAISIPASSTHSNEEIGPGSKRALVLITKIIQNVASNVHFSEPYMHPLNLFLDANTKKVLEFIRTISVITLIFKTNKKAVPANTPSTSDQISEVSDADVLRLYDFVYNNLADVKKYLYQIRSSEETPETGRARVQLLTTLTSHLGSSARKTTTNGQEQHPVQISSSVNIGDYNEFMERSKGKNIEAFKTAGVFYLAGMSKVYLSTALTDSSNIGLYYAL